MRNYSLPILLSAVLVVMVVGCAGGTGSSSKSGGGSGGGGGGGTNIWPNTGATVPGNSSLGLAASPQAPSVPGGISHERQVAQAVNDFRQQNGRSQLVWMDAIADAERSHAGDCEQRGYFGHGAKHDPGNYNICVQRGQFLNLPGYLWECGYGGSGSGALPCWANSSAHRDALLDASLQYHGVGIGSCGAPTFWASLR